MNLTAVLIRVTVRFFNGHPLPYLLGVCRPDRFIEFSPPGFPVGSAQGTAYSCDRLLSPF